MSDLPCIEDSLVRSMHLLHQIEACSASNRILTPVLSSVGQESVAAASYDTDRKVTLSPTTMRQVFGGEMGAIPSGLSPARRMGAALPCSRSAIG